MSVVRVTSPDVPQELGLSLQELRDDNENDVVVARPSMEGPLDEGERLQSTTCDLHYRLDGLRDCKVFFTLQNKILG